MPCLNVGHIQIKPNLFVYHYLFCFSLFITLSFYFIVSLSSVVTFSKYHLATYLSNLN